MTKKIIIPVAILMIAIGSILTFELPGIQTQSNNQEPDKTPQSENIAPEKSDSKKLDFSNQGLTTFPMSITNTNRSATILNLSGNEIRTIPSEIGKLSNLQELYLQNNRLDSLAAEVGQFKELKILDVSNNQITGIPGEIGHLRNLQILNLSDNGITDIPNEFYELKNASEINLSGNPINQSKIDELRKQLPGVSIVF